MKINYFKWGAHSPKGNWQFATPYININYNKGDHTQISFVVGSHHWWIIINKKRK